MLQAKTLPDDKRDDFLQAFSELPQHVLWKWEADTLPGKPKNFWTEKQCPQNDILISFHAQLYLMQQTFMLIYRAIYCHCDSISSYVL